jgi:hypothetical protein
LNLETDLTRRRAVSRRGGNVCNLYRDLPAVGIERPWQAAAIVNFYSLLILTPVYFLYFGTDLLSVTPTDVITQPVMEGPCGDAPAFLSEAA